MKGKAFILGMALMLWAPLAWAGAGADTATQLVRVASDIRRIEGRLQALEARVDDLTRHGARLEADYAAQQAKMATTLAGIARLQRMPREAVLVRPGGPLQAARTTMLLQSTLPVIERDSTQLRTLWQSLSQNRQTLEAQTQEARAAKQALSEAHDSLSALMRRRGTAAVDAGKVQALAQQAVDLRDLLTRLQDSEMDGVQFIPQEIERGGRVQADAGVLPVSGVIRTAYGARQSQGGPSQGVRIGTLAGALVVAPLDGVIRFTGPFKGYGNIVIMAHKGGYHSLIAGFEHIDAVVGQKVVAGEPIGLSSAIKGAQNESGIYFELRLHGQAVNPARKIPDLG